MWPTGGGSSIVEARCLDDIAAAIEAPGFGVAVVDVPQRPPGVWAALLRPLADRLGFVIVRAAHATARAGGQAPFSRHVICVCECPSDREAAAMAVRRLAVSSPRRHAVVLAGGSGEAALSGGGGEAEEAEIPWVRRAIEMMTMDRWTDARREFSVGWMLQAEWPKFAAMACARAEWLWDTGASAAAEAQVNGVAAEAQLRRVRLPPRARALLAEMSFWTGRPLHSAIQSGHSRVAPGADEIGWSGLSCWIRGDQTGHARAQARLRRGNGTGAPAARFWCAVLALVSVAPGALRGHLREAIGIATSAELPRRWRRLARGLAAARWMSAGRCTSARRALPAARQALGPDALLCRAVTSRLDGGRPDGGEVDSTIRRLGLSGLEALVSRGGKMHSIAGLTGLVRAYADADDDLAALLAGCDWLRRHADASAAGFVDASGERLVAARGWRPQDLVSAIPEVLRAPPPDAASPDDGRRGSLSAPVHYAGATVGFVVVRGRPEGRSVLEEAARTVAAMSGAALRAAVEARTEADGVDRMLPEILGHSDAIRGVRAAVIKAAATAFPVLIEGESGTGKELVARALHRLSPRRPRRFAAVNCAALSDELVEAELFGHTRGAFTGAVGARVGLFEEAHAGTLFLDEVGELSPRAQAKLLRALQEREIRRVGENVPRPVDVRVIAATNVPLSDASSAGRFRDDLRFRLAVVTIRMPPLRERVEDLPALAQAFWNRALAETGKRVTLTADALMRLCRHPWPGNVRELQNVMAALAVLSSSRGRIGRRHVDQIIAAGAALNDRPALPLDTARQSFERRLVAEALARHGGRRRHAAVELGLTRQGLAKALRRLGLEPPDAEGVA